MNKRLPGLIVALLLIAGAAAWITGRADSTITVTARFEHTVGLYKGDDVRMVGVPVGKITQINAVGGHVEVVMEIDASVPAAADTGAVIVPPGLLASRYIQLTEPWIDGPQLQDGAELDESRTAAPLELDAVTAQMDKFLVALGPQGANRNGALTDLVRTSDVALDGNGDLLRQSLADFADALDTIGESRGDIVGTIEQLQVFVRALAGSDQEIRSLEKNMAAFTTGLARQHTQLDATIDGLATTSRVVNDFIRRNGSLITTNVETLARITTTLADRQRELTEIADLTPLGIEAVFGSTNLDTATLDARIDLTPLLAHPNTALCQILEGAGLPDLCPPNVPQDPGSAR
jgi:phospholipid/cholesterol/gamma-HCH transport system substrate-binding protein